MKKVKLFDIIVYILLGLSGLIVLYPLIYIVSASFSAQIGRAHV